MKSWMSHRSILALAVATLMAGCAGPGSRDADDRAAARREAERELDRECRMAARTGERNPRCPQKEDPEFAPMESPPVLPPVSLPR